MLLRWSIIVNGTLVLIKEPNPEDLKVIEAMHKRMGFDYQFPDTMKQPAVLTRVASNGNGIAAAAHLRKEAEAYLWLDIDAPARARWEAIQALDRECCPILKSQGFDQMVAWIPKQIEWEFSHALVKLGFLRARTNFAAWSKQL